MINKKQALKVILLILLAGLTSVLSRYFIEPAARFFDYGDTLGRMLRDLVLFSSDYLLPWLAFLPLIIIAYSKRPFDKTRLVSFAFFHLAVCFLFSFAKGLAHVFILHPPEMWSHRPVPDWLIGTGFLYLRNDLVFYIAVIGVYQAILYLRKLRQKEIDEARLAETLATAQLHSLKMKLQPHFLFNALQSISVLVLEKDTEAATEMLEQLGNLLRISMDSDESQLVPLEKELLILDCYLEIEKIRFRDRLSVRKEVDESAGAAYVPNLVIQPLVENAIKHGISRRIEPGEVVIGVRREGGDLAIRVSNDGPPLDENWRRSIERGVGLSTTIRRLRLLFQDSFKFEMRNAPQRGVVTEVIIPFIENAE